MVFYWTLQLERFKRILKYLGINPLAFFILSPPLLFILVKAVYLQSEYASLIISGLAIYLFVVLADNNRNAFLKQHFGKINLYKIRVFENIIISIPISLMMLINEISTSAIIPILAGFFFSFFDINTQGSIKIPTPFGKSPFEFTSGFRQYILLFIFEYVLFAIGLIVDNYNLALVCMGSMFFIIIHFYRFSETYFFVWAHDKSNHQFLKTKIMTGIKYAFIVILPALITLLFCYPHFIFITSLVLAWGFAIVIMSILFKYAFYPRTNNIVTYLIYFGSMFLPFLMIITIPFYTKKSLMNLKLLLNDRN